MMNLRKAQQEAIRAALSVGKIMRQNLASEKRADAVSRHDIKLELDVRCQNLIERALYRAFPEVSFLGEEGDAEEQESEFRWVVDPIDGTVNYAYGLPHACVSIALQRKVSKQKGPALNDATVYPDGYKTQMGIVYDPFRDELWTAMLGQPARLNNKPIHVSKRRRLADAIVTMGLSKTPQHLTATLPVLGRVARRVRKIRILGAAALDIAYVATGRFDGFLEQGIRLWDIAAGALLVESAGGVLFREQIPGRHAYRVIASNGLLQKQLRLLGRKAQFNSH
jgi:myo-inositol-1(or 4)-monophosphatase